MPQTKFVLRHALKYGLKPIVVINKIDRKASRVKDVLGFTQDLFLELATSPDQLDFPVLYASAKEGTAVTEPSMTGKDISPIFDCILEKVPPPQIQSGSFQMLVSNLDYDSHKGKIAIGRVWRGKVCPHDLVVSINIDGNLNYSEVNQVFTHLGLKRLEVDEASAGDIVAITGIGDM